MTTWITNPNGDLVFTHGPWTAIRSGARVEVTHTDADIQVDVNESDLEVFGESGGSVWARYAVRVYIPIPVLRAILEAVDAAKEVQ